MARNGEGTTHPRGDDSAASIEVKGVYGLHSRRPLVELTAGEASVRIDAEKALELGTMLIQAAMSTRADGFVFEFARTELGVDDLAAALMLRKFQAWRLSSEQGTTGGATRASSDSASNPSMDVLASFLTSAERATKA